MHHWQPTSPTDSVHGTPQDGSTLPVLGWKEHAALPDWGITRLRVKLDTGAKTSAIGVSAAEIVGRHQLEGRDLPVLRLVIPMGKHDTARTVEAVTPVVAYKSVRDTRARPERRPVVRTRVVCGPLDEVLEVTITDRSGMNFRMILGRDALVGSAIVDPAREYTTERSRGGR